MKSTNRGNTDSALVNRMITTVQDGVPIPGSPARAKRPNLLQIVERNEENKNDDDEDGESPNKNNP